MQSVYIKIYKKIKEMVTNIHKSRHQQLEVQQQDKHEVLSITAEVMCVPDAIYSTKIMNQ